MKTYLHTLIAVAAFLIQTSYVQGQYTYQTAKRYVFGVSAFIYTDSTITLQPGVETGCAWLTSNPAWFLIGACASGNVQLQIDAQKPSFPFATDTVSIIIYGPFTDTVNLAGKLINANIDTCFNEIFLTNNGIGWSLNSFNYHKGDIYMALVTSSNRVYNVAVNGSSPPFIEMDEDYCPLCNSQLSELFQQVCVVTYDSASQKNKIIWTKDIFSPAQDYVIFRKNVTGTFDTIAYQSVSQLSEYVDVSSSPLSKAEGYRLGIRDSCGQLMLKDHIGPYGLNPFTTMHLIAYPTGINSAGLIWNAGSFQGPFLIYRTDPSGITTLIDSTGLITGSSQTYSDINAPAGICSYQVGVNINPPCVASLLPTYNIVKSNPGYVTVTGINELADLSKAISIEPNPFNQFTKIDLHLFTKQNLKVVLRNLTGQVVMQFDDVKTDELIIDRNNLSQGLYFLEVTGKDFYARKKLVVD